VYQVAKTILQVLVRQHLQIDKNTQFDICLHFSFYCCGWHRKSTMFSSLVRHTTRCVTGTRALSGVSGFPAPRLFDYETVTSNLSVADAIESVEEAFSALARGKVDVPMPMHIGIEESSVAGPGDCHIKGGYVSGTPTFTVKLACVSFYKNAERGLPPGSGIFIVVNAVTGAPLAVFQENRFMTDCEFNLGSFGKHHEQLCV
jgi:Ornithine cyclodeaminase/mu-crystallin family